MTILDTLEGRLNFERHLRTTATWPESLVSAGASLGKVAVSTDPKYSEAIKGDRTALKEEPGNHGLDLHTGATKRTLALSVWIFFKHFII